MQKIQTQGVHHLTFIGADRQTSIDFWEGVLGMPFLFEQPNLDVPEESHLYFDPGDGRLITVFTRERPATRPAAHAGGHRHVCITWRLSCRGPPICRRRSGWTSAACRTAARSIAASWTRSISATRWASCSSCPATSSSRRPDVTHADVLLEAHKLRVVQGDYNITEAHLADAIEALTQRTTRSLSDDRAPKNPYASRE